MSKRRFSARRLQQCRVRVNSAAFRRNRCLCFRWSVLRSHLFFLHPCEASSPRKSTRLSMIFASLFGLTPRTQMKSWRLLFNAVPITRRRLSVRLFDSAVSSSFRTSGRSRIISWARLSDCVQPLLSMQKPRISEQKKSTFQKAGINPIPNLSVSNVSKRIVRAV